MNTPIAPIEVKDLLLINSPKSSSITSTKTTVSGTQNVGRRTISIQASATAARNPSAAGGANELRLK